MKIAVGLFLVGGLSSLLFWGLVLKMLVAIGAVTLFGLIGYFLGKTSK